LLAILGIALGWILLVGGNDCGCDKPSSPSFIACINNKPVRMQFFGESATPTEVGSVDPSQWDCSYPVAPAYQNSINSPYPIASPINPSARQRRAVGSGTAYLPQKLRDLPFVPPIPTPPSPPGCDSSFTDVLQTIHTNAMVTRISTCPIQVKTTIPVVSRPLQIAITPDGATALVTSFDNAVNFIDLSTNRVSFTLMTDPSVNPHGIAISPDGTRAYVTSFNPFNSLVLVIDLTSRQVTATIQTIQYPQAATLTPDGSQLWIGSPLAPSVHIIDTLTNTPVTGLAIGQVTGIRFNSTGTHAYITSAANNPGAVVVVDTGTYKTVTTYTVGTGPTDVAISYDDGWLIVNNSGGNSISIIDLSKGTVTTTTVGANPSGIAFVN
jgi:YVTN family beta-propeller protein